MVSIIITTFNRPKLLERALKSALNQTYKDYEVIVVDDCSDIPVEANGVRIIRHEVNKGLSATRNTGIKAAKGKYVVCLDDDNELYPTFLEKTIQEIEKYSFSYSTFSGYDAVAVGRVIQYKDFADYVVPHIGGLSAIDWGWLIKKSVFDEIQYDESLRANEDTDFGIQFFKKFKAVQLNESLTIAYDSENPKDTDFGIQFFKQFKAIQLDEPLTIAYDSENPKDSLSFPNERELEGMMRFFKKNFHEYDESKEKWCLYRLMGRKFYRGGQRLKGLGYFWKGFWAYKTPRSLTHALVIMLGWNVYDIFMTCEEKLAARYR